MDNLTVELDTVTQTAAVIRWLPHREINPDDIALYTLKLWCDGTYKNVKELNDAARGPMVFQDVCIDP